MVLFMAMVHSEECSNCVGKTKKTTCWKSEGLVFDMLDDDFWTWIIEVLLGPSSHEAATIVCHPSKHP